MHPPSSSEDDLLRLSGRLLQEMRGIPPASPPLHQKILLFSMLDAAARARYPREKERERAVRLVESCATWEERFKVSLEQLKAHLEVMFSEEERRASRLYPRVLERIAPYRGKGCPPQSDAALFELEALATAEECEALERAKYSSLFYAYRQEVLRRFEEPGKIEEPAMTEVYYRPVEGGSFHLVFPLAFVRWLVGQCLEALVREAKSHEGPLTRGK